jgi:Cu2+-exporting ATPase
VTGAELSLSRASYRKMWQNLVWATDYNIIPVPLAAGVLTFAGIVLSPGRRCRADVRLHDRGGPQRPAAARRLKLSPAQAR